MKIRNPFKRFRNPFRNMKSSGAHMAVPVIICLLVSSEFLGEPVIDRIAAFFFLTGSLLMVVAYLINMARISNNGEIAVSRANANLFKFRLDSPWKLRQVVFTIAMILPLPQEGYLTSVFVLVVNILSMMSLEYSVQEDLLLFERGEDEKAKKELWKRYRVARKQLRR